MVSQVQEAVEEVAKLEQEMVDLMRRSDVGGVERVARASEASCREPAPGFDAAR